MPNQLPQWAFDLSKDNTSTAANDKVISPAQSQDQIIKHDEMASMPAYEPPGVRSSSLLKAATIKAADNGTTISDEWLKLSQSPESGTAILKKTGDEFNKQVLDAQIKIAGDSMANVPSPMEFANQAKQSVQAQQSKDTQTSAPQRAFLDAASGTSTPLNEDIANRMQLVSQVEDILKDTSWAQTGTELLTGLIPFKEYSDTVQALGGVNPFEQADHYRRLAFKIQALPPEERTKQFEILKAEWLDKLPPNRAAELLLGLIDPSATESAASRIGTWGAVGLATDVATLWPVIKVLKDSYNAISAAAKAGKEAKQAYKAGAMGGSPQGRKTAAEMNVQLLLGDDFIAAGSGVDKTTATANASPFLLEGTVSNGMDGLSPAIHERLFQFRDEILKRLGYISDQSGYVKEGMLDTKDREAAVRRINDEFGQWTQHMLKDQSKVIRLQSQRETHRGVEFMYEVTDPYGNLSYGSTLMPFKKEDVSFWQNIPDNVLINKFGSEKWQAAKSDYLDTVNSAIRLDTTSAAVGDQLRKLAKLVPEGLKKVKSPLSKKKRMEEVDAVLLFGDSQNKMFTPDELRAGVNGFQFDEGQIETYYRTRTMFDALGLLRNMEDRAEKAARGVKQIRWGEESISFGTLIDDVKEARAYLSNNPEIRKIWAGDRTISVNGTALEDMYRQGKKLAKLEDDHLAQGGVYRHAIVEGHQIEDLPAIIHDLKTGYVPRLNKQATWFVQAIQDSVVDGALKKGSRRKAVRSFDNEREAKAWTKLMYENPEQYGFDKTTHFIPVKDGELEAFRAGDSQLGATRGLITGPRAKEAIPHGYPGQFEVDAMRMKAFEALELYMENTKNFVTRNQFRMGMRLKWENTASRMLGGQKVSFDNPGPALDNKALSDLYKKIQEWSGFRDKSEKAWEEAVRKTYEWAIGPKDWWVAQSAGGRSKYKTLLLDLRTKDPLSFLRSVAFHALLGTYNPVQLFVQAQGAAVALAVAAVKGGPKAVMDAFQKQLVLSYMQHAEDLDRLGMPILRKLVKAGNFKSVDELKAFKEIWRRTGYYESTLTSADVEAAARGFPTTRNALSRFFDSGLMFFRSGELFNRRFSWAHAVSEAGGAEALLKDEAALKAAMTRANDMMLSLSRANRAQFQKGLISLPTQFLQIQTKTLETLLGRNVSLDRKERIALLLSQAMLYGPAGMFAGKFFAKYATDLLGNDQIDVNNWSDAHRAAVNGGFTDWALAMMGIDGVFSDRAALFNGMDQTITNLWTKDNTFAEWILGPSGVPLKRVWQAWQMASPFSWAPRRADGTVSFSASDIVDAMTFFAQDVGNLIKSPFSTASQISRYLLMHDMGVLKDTQGNTIAKPVGGFNPQTEIAALLGVKPEMLQRKFDLADMNDAYDEAVKLRVNMLMNLFDQYMSFVDQHNGDYSAVDQTALRLYRKRWDITVNSISDPGLREKVREAFALKLRDRLTGKSQLDRQIQEYYRNFVTQLMDAHTDWDTRLIKTREQ